VIVVAAAVVVIVVAAAVVVIVVAAAAAAVAQKFLGGEGWNSYTCLGNGCVCSIPLRRLEQ